MIAKVKCGDVWTFLRVLSFCRSTVFSRTESGQIGSGPNGSDQVASSRNESNRIDADSIGANSIGRIMSGTESHRF